MTFNPTVGRGSPMSKDTSAFALSIREDAAKLDDNAMVIEDFNLAAPQEQLFVNATLKIVKGHRYGLLGPNGKGKTTILRHIVSGQFPHPPTWDILLVEQEAKATDRSVLEEVLSADAEGQRLISEEKRLMEALENVTEIEETNAISEELEKVIQELMARGIDKQEAQVRRILNGLGFVGSLQDKMVRDFSGGWRMRVSLAKALFIQPKLLMLDEPTNHLDLDAVLWLDHYLAEEYPHTIIVVSHDADFLDSVCTDIIWVNNRKLNAFRGGYTEFSKMRAQQYATQEKDWDQFQRAYKNCKTKQEKEACEKKYASVEKPVDYRVKFLLKGQGADRSLGGITMSEVNFAYDGGASGRWLLSNIEFGVDCGSRIALVGANGSGKSTFLKLLTGELAASEGDIRKTPGLKVQLFSQHFEEGLDLTMTPVDFILKIAQQAKDERVITAEHARQCLGRYGLPSEGHLKLIGQLSGGQKARVAFAMLGLAAPHILVLDEPTNHLDIETVEALISALKAYTGGVVMVTHDARLVTQVECDLWICERGGIFKFNGEFDQYRAALIADLSRREKEAEEQRMKAREARKMGIKAPKVVQVNQAEPSVALLGNGGKTEETLPKKAGGVSLNLEGFSFGGKLKKKIAPTKIDLK
jgi:ATP-binding cassette subfamily F protein 1